jgi:predicted glycoside hydrolase/deacetylase ChbG (UPF0249 family)
MHILRQFVFVLIFISFSLTNTKGQSPDSIYLIVRADDIASAHAANKACIDVYTHGIAQSVEIMVNCPWFPEAVELLNQNPGYDVGVHLMLTSEWNKVKWRPLTHCPSLTDENGYFFPMIWPNDNYPLDKTLRGAKWNLKEIEQELRAQIELAKRNIKHLSHVSTHMGFGSIDPAVDQLVDDLAKEYGLFVDFSQHQVKGMKGWKNDQSTKQKIDAFAKNLNELKPGIYLFVEHPAYNEPEMHAYFHTGYTTVAADRDDVTRVFTSKKVQEILGKKKIKLMSYAELKAF